jgi:hypothetical protein
MTVSFLCAKKLAVLPELMKPGVMFIQENELFVLDGVTVYVYSLQDYRLMVKFGKRGHGPGELVPNDEITLNMHWVKGNIFLDSQTKFIYYSKDGKMITEKTLPFTCMQIAPLGNGYAVVKVNVLETGEITLDVILMDEQLNPIKTLISINREELSPQRKIIIPPPYIYLQCVEDRLFVTGGAQRNFYIQSFDKQGNPLQPIQMPYDRLELSASFKKELSEWFKSSSRFGSVPPEVFQRISFLDYFPAIRDVVVTDKQGGGRVYVQTYKLRDNNSEFYVFDSQGKVLKHVFLPTASGDKIKLNHEKTFTFYGNAYYYLVDNEDKEEWELHMEGLN